MVRGIRLIATGVVDQPSLAALPPADAPPEPVTTRRLYAGGTWHDAAPVHAADHLRPGPALPGPALIQSPFTTLVLAPTDTATLLPTGDILVTVNPG